MIQLCLSYLRKERKMGFMRNLKGRGESSKILKKKKEDTGFFKKQ